MANEEIDFDSKHKIAFQLMKEISNYAKGEPEPDKKDRNYYLTLYWQCVRAGQTMDLESILEQTPKPKP